MTNRNFVVMSLAAVCLSACGSQSPSGQAKDRGGGEVVASAEENLAAEGSGNNEVVTSGEERMATATLRLKGSGIFGLDCEASTGKYEVVLAKGDDGFVSAQVTSDSGRFKNLLTSYSYMGNATPTEFEIAIIFDPANAPVPDAEDGDPRIEIWKGESAFYGLINGNKSGRLDFCASLAS